MSGPSTARVAVLGAGRVGALIARDLAGDPELRVLAVDRSESALAVLAASSRIETRTADLSSAAAITAVCGEADVVVGAVPGALGHRTLAAVIRARRPAVDISFMPEDPSDLDAAARDAGIAVVTDCGVAPGLSNWFVGRSVAELDDVERVEIWVGGLPLRRVWPYEYRAVFSPADVIEEYTRPCRMRENGLDVVVPALSGVESVEIEAVGTLEGFYTDGLRSLLNSIPAPTLREKTLRYPGHADRVRMLRETGFFDERPIAVGGREVVPRALTETLLGRAWALEDGEQEFTVLRVVVSGRRGGRPAEATWNLFDRTDAATGATSMARTTGFPCAIVARMLAGGRWTRPGVYAPEELGRDLGLTELLLVELERRGVQITRRQA